MISRDITIIVVTYNSGHIVESCLGDLVGDYSVIVVDNGSSDDTCERVSGLGSDSIRVIKNSSNLGFGSAMNIGLRACETRYALMLNPDVVMDGMSIERLRFALDSADGAVLAGPRYTGEGGGKSYRIQPFSLFHKNNPLFRSYFSFRSKYRSVRDLSSYYYCGFVSGAVMLYDLLSVGDVIYFDEDIFMYYEDGEFQYRLLSSGHRIILDAGCVAEHVGGASSMFVDSVERVRFHNYQMGYSRGLLAFKYPWLVSRFDMWIFVWRTYLLGLFFGFFRFFGFGLLGMKYRMRYLGFCGGMVKSGGLSIE